MTMQECPHNKEDSTLTHLITLKLQRNQDDTHALKEKEHARIHQ